MRTACTSTPQGHIYRVYRTELHVASALKQIIPLLLANKVHIVVGRVGDDPSLLMRVGPISGAAEATFLNLIESQLTARRVPVFS